MSEQPPLFVHTSLTHKLEERLNNALIYVSKLSKEDVLRCDGGCLTQIIREFAVAPPILRRDLMVADELIIEAVDESFDRKIGQTNHSFFIPVERDPEWLEEVRSQRPAVDGYPLAFLDKKRARINIRLMLSPEDEEGALKRKLDYRANLVEQYAASVAEKLVEFNRDLAEKMTAELNKRKAAILKARKELENTGLPLVHNPEHAERAIKIERVLRSLGEAMTGAPSRSEETGGWEVRTFIVHGHDHQSLYELKDYLQNTLRLGEPVVLRQMPGLGKTLIEKFEREAEAAELVFVLLTPDDHVADPSEPDSQKRRARQNVILELGFFLGKLGRESGRVLLLHKGPVEIPSDIIGIEYIDITDGIESAGEGIRRELRALGILK
ncbi:MAG TPA: nucleotide-binding protein [Pyrinomonadaceae bacterium]|nr:nucleotide-binding protein [Pyrinomonadaceae bacterium]